eukprot:4787963-Prymnesium_polylepis.1
MVTCGARSPPMLKNRRCLGDGGGFRQERGGQRGAAVCARRETRQVCAALPYFVDGWRDHVTCDSVLCNT